MAYILPSHADVTERELKALERGYRRDLLDLAAARASYPSLRDIANRDEREIRRALARVETLLGRSEVQREVQERMPLMEQVYG